MNIWKLMAVKVVKLLYIFYRWKQFNVEMKKKMAADINQTTGNNF